MFISKKSFPRNDSVRYTSKLNDQEISFVFTHRLNDVLSRNQSSNGSLASSRQRVLKLRGNSRNSDVKAEGDFYKKVNDKKLSSNNSINNIEISKKNQQSFNSKQSISSKVNFNQNCESNTKKPSSSSSKINSSSLHLNLNASYSKTNKQNIMSSGRQLQKKKSTQKGLVLTKKNSIENSLMVEGYQSCGKNNLVVKPKSARVDKPLAENYLILNLNQFQSKQRQGDKRNKLSIDFDSFLNQNKNGNANLQQNDSNNINEINFGKRQKEQQNQVVLDNFYSQRNSVSNFYQTGNYSKQSSREKLTIKQKYGGMKLTKKVYEEVEKENIQQQTRIEFDELLKSLNSKRHKDIGSSVGMSQQKININTMRQHNKPQYQINCIEQNINPNVQSKHKRILSILQKGSNLTYNNQIDHIPSKKHLDNNYFSLSNQQNHQKLQKQKQKQRRKLNEIVKYSPNSFNYDYVVGKGGFGKVWRVNCKRTDGVFALKEMSKALIISKKSVPSVMNQQQLLKDLKHPFIVNMIQSFQTRQNLYLMMDYLSAGDLRHHLSLKKYFTQDQTKFIIICILLGLKYLHGKGIIHRDIKPENIVLDEKGYARITDLGVARKWREGNSCDTSGTPGYMAPEVLCRQNHSYEVDYFAVGVITYEMMLRKRPYYGRSRKQIRDQVLSRQVQIKKQDIPDGWSLQCADFINRMIQRKPNNRLGYNNIDQIFSHPWLKSAPIQRIQQKKIYAPYIPSKYEKGESECVNYTTSQETEMKELIAQNEIMLRQKDVQDLFSGYEHY